MKFESGDATDDALCTAIQHEFLRCDDAFNHFVECATTVVRLGEDRRCAYNTYNAYARFIHHLYEFMIGAIARDRHDTELKADLADKYIASHAQRVLTNRRDDILHGTAPTWDNHISAFPEEIHPTFAQEFRQMRNIAIAHADHRRSGHSLSDFYAKNHKFLVMLFRDAQSWWGRMSSEFPDLGEITAFTVLLKGERLDQGR